MTKEEVLQKVNDYCNEKSYTTATLTDGFKDKFAEHFQKLNPDGDINDETVLGNLKFNLNTAFSSASQIVTDKTRAFETKENEYKSQIAELQKKLGEQSITPPTPPAIPKEVQDQLDELKRFKSEGVKKEKFKNIIQIAKTGIRQDLHKSFETYAKSYNVLLDKEDKEQAESLVANFQEIFKDSIGDIKPMRPQQTIKQDEEFLSSLPKIKI